MSKFQRIVCLILVLALFMSVQILGSGKKAEAAKVTIELWTFLNPEAPDPRGQALKQIVEMFEKKYPEIDLEVKTIHWREIDKAAIRAVAAGGGPDVLNVYSDQLPNHVAAGTLQPVDTYFNTWYAQNKEDYLWSSKMLTINDHVWSAAWESRVWLLWYRADLLDAVGAKEPQDLYELAEVAAKIKGKYPNVQGFAWGLSTKSLAAAFIETFIPLLVGEGGQLLGENGEAAYNTDAGVKVMQYIRDLVNKYGAMDTAMLSMDADEILSGVGASTIAMTTQGSMRVSTARKSEGVGENLKTMPVPSFDPSKSSPAFTAGQTLGIGKNTKHPDEAWKFIEFMLEPEAQLIFAKAGVLPVRSQVYNDPWFDTPLGKEMTRWREYVIKHGITFFPPEDYWKFCEILALTAQKVVSEPDLNIKEALDKAAEEYNRYHKEFKKE